MGNRILVLISWLIGLGVVLVVGGVIVLGVLAATGDFGKANECVSQASDASATAPRGVSTDLALAGRWDTKWKTFDNALGAGQSGSVSFTESEVTSKANQFLKDKGAPLDDIVVCFHDGEAEARAKVELPVLGGIPVIGGAFETKVKMKGTVDTSGAHPKIAITDLEAGNLPSTATDQ